MASIRATGCCGMKEIDNISHNTKPENILRDVKEELGRAARYSLPFMLFSGVTKRVVGDHASNRTDNYAQNFADFITANDFGSLAKTEEKTNPRTGNSITVWIWTVNYQKLWAWYDVKDAEEKAKLEKAKLELLRRTEEDNKFYALKYNNSYPVPTTHYYISPYGNSTSNS